VIDDNLLIDFPLCSLHGSQQSLVRQSLFVRHVQRELGLEVKILRVRREAGVQEVLREDAQRIAKTLEGLAREHDEKVSGLVESHQSQFLLNVFVSQRKKNFFIYLTNEKQKPN
jgi:hypothetical protein